MAKLTDKQRRFCDEYLVDLNATQAAIRAGYSPDSAQQIGSENLSKPVIKNVIAKAMAERSRRTGVSQDRVLNELAKMAFVNIADVINLEDATIRDGAADADLACIQSVKIKPSQFGEEREIKLYDKKSSLELIGRHLGMWNGDSNKNENGALEDILDAVRGVGND